MPRRVALIVTPQYLPFLGGMERECALLAGELRRRGWHPVIVTEQLGLPTPRLEDADGIRVHRVPSSPRRSLAVQLRAAAGIARLVLRYRREAELAIVRTTTLPALVVGLLKASGAIRFPTLVTAETGGDEDDVVALSRRRLFSVSRRLVSSHDVLNGLCQANVDHLREHGFPEAKIVSIPNGIDTAVWSTVEPPSRIRRFLFLGRLDPEKGVFELVEAFADTLARHPEVTLTVAGDGPARAELERRCEELGVAGSVEFAGRVEYEHLGELFGRIDCLVLPSYSEGMPLSVLEAAAHRRALILTPVGDLGRLFGAYARMVPPRDVGALAAAMREAVEDPAPRADYEEVVEAVSIGRVVDAMLARLDEPQGRRKRNSPQP